MQAALGDRSEATAEGIETVRAKSRLLRAAGGRFGILLVALIALLASAPLIIERPAGNVALALLADAVLVASLHAARPGRGPLVLGVVLALADFGIGRLVALETFEGARRPILFLQLLLWLSILIFVTATILEAIFASESVEVETLQASLCVYMLLGLLWVFLYGLVGLAAPDSFQGPPGTRVALSDDRSRRLEFMRLFIFSYATLTGTGYSDLTPATDFARMVACLESMAAQVYLAVVIARLVGMQAGPAPPVRPARGDEGDAIRAP
jgi:voltage-gated potassium channel